MSFLRHPEALQISGHAAAVPRVMLKCPKTGQDVAMGMSTDAESFATLQVNRARVKCAACGEDHVVERNDLFLERPQNPFQR